MTTKIIDTPNTETSSLIDELKSIHSQGRKYAKYDIHAPSFKIDLNDPDDEETIEQFFTFKKFMFDKIIIILIIGLLAIFIMKAMEFM